MGGVPLPLICHGGSAMLTAMLGFGLLMSAHVHRDAEFGPALRVGTQVREDWGWTKPWWALRSASRAWLELACTVMGA